MNKKIKKGIIGLVAGIVIGCILTIGVIAINDKINTNNGNKNNENNKNNKNVTTEVTNNQTEVQNNVDIKVREYFKNIARTDTKALVSSIPYDHINTTYYNRVVDLGVEAVPVIEDMYYSEEIVGVDAYIAGLVLEEIVQCKLGQLSDIEIENPKDFFVAWSDIADNFTTNIKSIMSDNTTDEVSKLQRIQLYGVLGESFLYNVVKCENTTITYVGEEFECGGLAEYMNSVGYTVKITEEEDEFIREYLEVR